MEIRFKSLPHEDALAFAREYMGFTADFSFKLTRQITANTETYLADLGALTVGTELTFSLNGSDSPYQVSLDDSPETSTWIDWRPRFPFSWGSAGFLLT